MPLNERDTHKGMLSRDSETYKRVYELLEEHTFSWITDAWQKRPTPDAIEELPLKYPSRDEMLSLADEHDVSRESAISALEHGKSRTLIRVNGETCAIAKDVVREIMTVLRMHAAG
jgi:hypothetical protein